MQKAGKGGNRAMAHVLSCRGARGGPQKENRSRSPGLPVAKTEGLTLCLRYEVATDVDNLALTSLYDHGVAPTKIQVAAGHSDIRTTNGYCRSEICDEIDISVLDKAL